MNDADGNLALLPEGMDLGAATMVSDMVPTGFHGAEIADIQFGDDVAVIGIGPVMQVAKFKPLIWKYRPCALLAA